MFYSEEPDHDYKGGRTVEVTITFAVPERMVLTERKALLHAADYIDLWLNTLPHVHKAWGRGFRIEADQ